MLGSQSRASTISVKDTRRESKHPGNRDSIIGVHDGVLSADRVWLDVMKDEKVAQKKENITFADELHNVMSGRCYNVVILVLLMVDASIFALRTLNIDVIVDNEEYFNYLSMLLLGIFVIEQLLRMSVNICGWLRSPFEVVDFLLVMSSMTLLLDEQFNNIIIPKSVAAYINSLVLLIIQCARLGVRGFTRGRQLCPSVRHLVGQNKQRYQRDGFDLDLTYITKRVIAMGLPSQGIEGQYRNPIDQVVRFFETKYSEHYMLINLCSERTYPASKFKGRVVRFPFDDHNPPPLATMLRFCMFVDSFLKEHTSNIVAIHCKGGKGRTGTMVCAWLMFSRVDLYSEQVLRLFAHQRTDSEIQGALQGVAGPSQIRYVNYFEKLRLTGIQEDGDILNTAALETESDVRAAKISVDACKTKVENAPKCELVSLRMNHVLTKAKYKDSLTDQRHRDNYASNWNAAKNWSLIITHYPADSVESKNEFESDEGGNKYEYSSGNDYFYKASSEGQDDATSVFINIRSWQKGSNSVVLAGDMKFQIYRNKHATESTNTSKVGGSGFKTDDQLGDASLFATFWLHTSFLTPHGEHLILRKKDVDEVHKNEALDEEFNIDLEYVLPAKEDEAKSPDKKLVRSGKSKSKKLNDTNKKSLRKKKHTSMKRSHSGIEMTDIAAETKKTNDPFSSSSTDPFGDEPVNDPFAQPTTADPFANAIAEEPAAVTKPDDVAIDMDFFGEAAEAQAKEEKQAEDVLDFFSG